MSISAIIVDDEAAGRNNLQQAVENYCEDVLIIGKAANVPDAVKMIHRLKPNLVFLDISMPGENGFALLDYFPQESPPPAIIFVTAYEEYAIQALRISAVDYLLKPIDIEDLRKAIEKVKIHLNEDKQSHYQSLKANLRAPLNRLVLPHQGGHLFLTFDEIVCIVADRNYSEVHLSDGRKIVLAKSLSHYTDILPDHLFFRPHRSYIINLKHVREYVKKDGGYILMTNGTTVQIVSSRKDAFFALFRSSQV